MAIVTSIEKDLDRLIRSPNPTMTSCTYLVGEFEGVRMIQLDTAGSADRKMPGKTSQTQQFTSGSAHQLYRILKSEFGFKD